MLRSLTHYWRINAAVIAGAAIATAVLAGAVIVGDSMRASLRQMTLDRLGAIDAALISSEFFTEELASALERSGAAQTLAPALMLSASAVHGESRALAGGVTLLGIDARFASFYESIDLEAALERGEAQLFPSVVINRSLARELAAEVGEAIVLSYQSASDIPRESLLGNAATEQEVGGLRLTVTAVIPDRGPGRFSVSAHQQQTLNAYVRLSDLQARLDRRGRVNALFAGGARSPEALADALETTASLPDLGLEIDTADGLLRLSNRRFILRDSTVEAALAQSAPRPRQAVLGYLANEMRVGANSIPYSMVLGLDTPIEPVLGPLEDLDSGPVSALPDDQVLLGEWAARELDAAPGDTLEMTFFQVGANDELTSTTARLEVAGIASMTGLMTDGDILPAFPGIADADDIASWEPPFPMDLGLIRPADEEYWDLYGPAPKAVVNLATARKLWTNRFGSITAIRAAIEPDEVDRWVRELKARLDPADFGLTFEPVKAQGLEASAGATDFSGLFIGFSIFLIASSILVVGLLFNLSVGLRAREIGLRRAVGFPVSRVRRQLLLEGLVLAVIGGVLGAGLAVAYAAGLIRIIAMMWEPLLDLPVLILDLRPMSILASIAAAIAMVVLTILLGLRRLQKVSTPALLAGVSDPERASGRRPLGARIALVCGALAALVIAIAMIRGSASSPALFFTAGALLITTGFGAFAAWCRRPQHTLVRGGPGRYLRLAARNSAHNPRRSLLSVALVGCATFMLVSVAANRRELRPETLDHDSGTGGFTLVAETDVPIHAIPRSPQDWAELGVDSEAAASLSIEAFLPLRLLPGEDASCLNLYQPEKPRVVGVPPAFIDRGGFRFSATIRDSDNPWELLDSDLEEGVIAAIGDANSVRWILHSGLGRDIAIVDDHGREVRLRIVGLLDRSIFQSELVVSESNFLKHFPQHGGYSYFLFETPLEQSVEVSQALESGLAAYGFDVTPTAEKLARFLGIEEMYLSTFQLLGGLGLILGTVGLGIILMRNVNERRTELSMLRAFGFERRSIAWMIVLENGFQLLVGLLIGAAAGFLALLPHYLDSTLHLPWKSLLTTLGLVVAIGMTSSILGVLVALRAPLLPALKAE